MYSNVVLQYIVLSMGTASQTYSTPDWKLDVVEICTLQV